MLALRFTFPGGRYHATPWFKNVNEAAIAWPPEPYRILRALIAVWHRKLGGPQGPYPAAALGRLIDALATPKPVFQLPAGAIHSQSRHYMPVSGGATTLIFDAFLRLPDQAELFIGWPDLALDPEQQALLQTLAEALAYLGRAESWCEARLEPDWTPAEPCASPAEPEAVLAPDKVQLCHLLLPREPEDYQALRNRLLPQTLETPGQAGKRGRAKPAAKSASPLQPALPETLLDALSVETATLQAVGFARPPAAREVVYQIPIAAVPRVIARKVQKRRSDPSRDLPVMARFALAGRPLPRVTESLSLAERLRKAVLRAHGWQQTERGWRPKAPPEITGKDAEGRPLRTGHDHAWWLPEDADGDGLIDHVALFLQGGIGPELQRKLAGLDRLPRLEESHHDADDPDETRPKGEEPWHLALEGIGAWQDFQRSCRLVGESRIWQSVTPMLASGHLKRPGLEGYRREIARLMLRRQLLAAEEVAAVTVEFIEHPLSLRSLHFERFRERGREAQPDTQGALLRLELPRPLQGPLALGYASHFGLGLFARPDP